MVRYSPRAVPTYEYECSKCKKNFDAFQSMKDDAYTVCPKERCQMKTWGKGKVRRLLGTGAGLIFKGSGFYITDYRSEGYKSAAQKESSSSEPKKSESGGSSGESGGGSSAAAAAPAAPAPSAPSSEKTKTPAKKK